MCRLRLWLEANEKSRKKDEKDEIGRSRDEIYKAFTEYFKLYLQERKASSILAEVRAYYKNPGVLNLVGEEERAVGAIGDAKTPKEVLEKMKTEDQSFKNLLRVMAEEVKKPQQND